MLKETGDANEEEGHRVIKEESIHKLLQHSHDRVAHTQKTVESLKKYENLDTMSHNLVELICLMKSFRWLMHGVYYWLAVWFP